MLGMAIKQQRPLKPRVVIVVERSIMQSVLRAVTSPEAKTSGGLRNLYPAAGWVVVPDGTDINVGGKLSDWHAARPERHTLSGYPAVVD